MEATLDFRKRVRTARQLGREAAARAVDRADVDDPEFSRKALAFIVEYVQQRGQVPGESATLAAVNSGISPKDQRAFGPVYATALRRGLIHVVGYVPRIRGHGSAGGKLYAPGPDPKAVDA
ncbi:hypothetical protein [Variovorax sp. tm]|uniref:hypothetical protein n=1 Tax=Variovorax atrisoli TaxID=3394203 RepID=UPI003A80E82A